MLDESLTVAVMKSSFFYVLLVLATACGKTGCSNSNVSSVCDTVPSTGEVRDAPHYSPVCPLWSKTGGECGNSLGGIVTCYRGEVLIHSCYCITYDRSGSRGPLVGKCFFSCNSPGTLADNSSSLIAIPCTASPENLTDIFCSYWGRDGLMCGDCKDGYAPRVYSFDMSCMPCNPNRLYINLIKYVSAALLPPTAFLLLIIMLRIKITYGTLNWFIFFSQVVSFPFIVRSVLSSTKASRLPRIFYTYTKLFFSFYGIWNLDFFRPFMPGICFSSLNTRQAIALDGVIAVYPLLFLVILYTLIYLHDRNYRVVVFVWRPFRVCFTRCRQIWDIRNSVVDTFAVFILLSYNKTLNFVFDMGFPARIYQPSGKPFAETVYYDASISLNDKKHLPYLVLTVILFLVFNILPVLLLCLYPTKCGRRILRCSVSSGTLQILSDTVQGYYKDGTNGTRDLRFFPAVYLLTRIFLIFIYSTMLNRYAYLMIAITLVGVAIIVLLLQPYKTQFAKYNRIDAASILLLATLILTTSCVLLEPTTEGHFGYYTIVTAVSAVVLSLLPPLYVAFLLIQWTIRRIQSASVTYQALYNSE